MKTLTQTNPRQLRFGIAVTILIAFINVTSSMAESKTPKPSTTLPVKVDAWNPESDMAKIMQQWAYIEAVLSDKDYFANQNNDISAWTCGQQAGHLTLTLISFGDTVTELLDGPEQNVDGKVSDFGMSFLKTGVMPRGVGQAPAEVRPGATTRTELLEKLQDASNVWKTLSTRLDDIKKSKARIEHPAGMMSASDWLRLAAVHNAHHLKIVRDVLLANEKDATHLDPTGNTP